MAIINDETTQTHSNLGANTTVADADAPVVNTSDNSTDVSVFVDNGNGGAPADFTIVAQRYSEKEDRWMRFGADSVTGASNPQSFTDPAIPPKLRFIITNDSSSQATFRVSLVSY